MLNLAEYRQRPALLADWLPWAGLIAPGVVLNKDGSFQRTARFRGLIWTAPRRRIDRHDGTAKQRVAPAGFGLGAVRGSRAPVGRGLSAFRLSRTAVLAGGRRTPRCL